MITVAETPIFTRQCSKLFSEEERGFVTHFGLEGSAKGKGMSTFGEDLIQSLGEAVAHAQGQGIAIVHEPLSPREVRERAKLTQAQMAPLMGMSLSGYRKWEQGERRISGPAAALLRIIEKEPETVKRVLLAG